MRLAVSFVSFMLMFSTGCFSLDKSAIKSAHKTTHAIEMTTLFGTTGCSATAIGPNALLTASHCEQPNEVIELDGKPAKIISILRDGNDHSIFMLNVLFKDYAVFSTAPTEQGDDVFIFGNPGEFTDLFRKGSIAGALGDSRDSILIDLNGYFGDSGAAVFNDKGEIIGVNSAMIHPTNNGATIKFMIMYPMAFTPEQLLKVRGVSLWIPKLYKWKMQ